MLNGTPVTLIDITGPLASSAALKISDQVGLNYLTTPIAMGESGLGATIKGVGSGSERTRAQKKAVLDIRRFNFTDPPAALVGTFSVFGAYLPDPNGTRANANAYWPTESNTSLIFSNRSDLAVSSTRTFDATSLSTAAFTIYNWIVVVNGVILRYSATPAAGETTFTIAAGVVTIRTGAAATGYVGMPDRSEIVVYFIAASNIATIFDGSIPKQAYQQVTSRTVMWVSVGPLNLGADEQLLAVVSHLVD